MRVWISHETGPADSLSSWACGLTHSKRKEEGTALDYDHSSVNLGHRTRGKHRAHQVLMFMASMENASVFLHCVCGGRGKLIPSPQDEDCLSQITELTLWLFIAGMESEHSRHVTKLLLIVYHDA